MGIAQNHSTLTAPIDPFAMAARGYGRHRAQFGYVAVRLAFIEAHHRCPECNARGQEFHVAFDAARDRGILRRDVNEILETVTLETLADRAWMETF